MPDRPLGARPGRDAAYCSALIWNSQDSCPSACFGDRLSIRRGVDVALVRAASASATPGISRVGAVTALL